LKNHAGSLNKKPPRMKQKSFQRLRIKFVKYDEMQYDAAQKELRTWYGSRAEPFLGDPYCLLMPADLCDAYIER
jgi:hypothetical protein